MNLDNSSKVKKEHFHRQVNLACQGLITRNNNALELAHHFIPQGNNLFLRLRRYASFLSEANQDQGYPCQGQGQGQDLAAQFLVYLLPFLTAFGATDQQIEEYSTVSISLMPGVTRFLEAARAASIPCFLVSSAYRPFVQSLGYLLGFGESWIYYTPLNLDRYSINESEKEILKDLADEIINMPLLTWEQGRVENPGLASTAARRQQQLVAGQCPSIGDKAVRLGSAVTVSGLKAVRLGSAVTVSGLKAVRLGSAVTVSGLKAVRLGHSSKGHSLKESVLALKEVIAEHIPYRQRLKVIFEEEIANMQIGTIMAQTPARSGDEKVKAVIDSLQKTGNPAQGVLYFGCSVLDAPALDWVREAGGLAVSFNGDRAAVQSAEVAVMSGTCVILTILTDTFFRQGKEGVLELIKNWDLHKIQTDQLKIHPSFMNELFSYEPESFPQLELVESSNLERLIGKSESRRRMILGETM